jgi:hypothetical protein
LPTFRSAADLKQSLAAAGLEAYARDMAATLRPVILFLRELVPDEALHVGVSKLGGDPDLPADFPWPERPAFPDADQRAHTIEQRGVKISEGFKAMMLRDASGKYAITPEEIDQVVENYRGLAAFMYVAMPLAFVGQLNLDVLGQQAGLPEDFPDRGLLSIFADATSTMVAVHWHDRPITDLRRRPWPSRLIEYSDCYGGNADAPNDAGKWYKNTQAETLTPFSALAVPHHWKSAFATSSPAWSKMWAWFHNPHGAYDHSSDALSGSGTNFGDSLGGWPPDIQGHVETEIDGDKITRPGVTPWRHIFSWGAEYWQGRRCMAVDKGDGARYLLMHEDDLHARRFDKIRDAYQQT